MKYFCKILSRDVEAIGKIVVAGGDDDLLGTVIVNFSGAVGGRDAEISILPGHCFDPLILAHVKTKMVGHAAIVFERFLASRLLGGAGERNVADFQQLRRGEEGHVGGIVVD